ncbi:AraC family transcriptional regulator [uncultured Ilyobacter sp.]|uniref:helix-turn-helix domain-containing protein n=1 Tax=uncultured Ilyobacter sp. TaxID=544433 RepID=UPI0029F46574|nr:AraC family transcriptional regulator [uncultured Ilyobacter sp.]
MREKKREKKIEKTILLILFITSSMYIIYSLETQWKKDKSAYLEEANKFKTKSFNEISRVISFLTYVPQKYDKERAIAEISYKEEVDPLAMFTIQQKLKSDYFIFSKNNSNLAILDKKNKNVIGPYDTFELDDFIEENNLPENIYEVKGYKSKGKYFFVKPSLRKNIYYVLTINDDFFQLNAEDKRFGKWYFIYDGNLINTDEKTDSNEILKLVKSNEELENNIQIYYKEAETPEQNKVTRLLKDIFLYLSLNLIFLTILTKVLVSIAYKPIMKMMSNFGYEKNKEDDIISSMNRVYSKLKTENELLREINKKTVKYIRNKGLVDFFKGIIKFKDLDNSVKNNTETYKVFLGHTEINDYSDEEAISFKQEIGKFTEEKNGLFLLIDKDLIALLVPSDKLNRERIRVLLDDLESKYDMEINGFLSKKGYKIEELYNQYNGFMKFLDYKFQLREKKIISEDDINENSKDYYYPIGVEQRLINNIIDKRIDDVNKIYDDIFYENFEQRKISSVRFEKLKILISNTIRRIQESMPPEKRISEHLFSAVIESESVDILRNNVDKSINSLLETLPKPKDNTNKIINDKIDEFIKLNYAKDISLLDFAEYMGVTLQYASNLYKKIKNETFNKSLRKYRIEKSIELYNADNTLKIKDLSLMVGYTNTMTFINNFKREKGLPPGKFFVNKN